MQKPGYNFKRGEGKRKAVYKLVMYLKEGSGIRGHYKTTNGDRVLVFYGYFNKHDNGLQRLRGLAGAYRSRITYATIYAKPGLNPGHPDFSEIIEKFTT